MELNNTFFEKLLTVRCLKNTWKITWSELPVFQMMIPTLGGAILSSYSEFYGFCDTPVSSWKNRQHHPVKGWSHGLCVSAPSPDKLSITRCFLPLTSFSLTYPLFQNHGAFHNPKGRSLCHLPVQKGTSWSTRAPHWVGSSSCLLKAPHAFPAGLCPHAPFSSELKYFPPSRWVLVFGCFLHSRHPTHSMCRCVCHPHLNLSAYLQSLEQSLAQERSTVNTCPAAGQHGRGRDLGGVVDWWDPCRAQLFQVL